MSRSSGCRSSYGLTQTRRSDPKGITSSERGRKGCTLSHGGWACRSTCPKCHPSPTPRLTFEGCQYAKEHGKGNDYNHRVLEAFFVEGQDIGDIDVLTRLAGEIGLDEREFKEALRSRKY